MQLRSEERLIFHPCEGTLWIELNSVFPGKQNKMKMLSRIEIKIILLLIILYENRHYYWLNYKQQIKEKLKIYNKEKKNNKSAVSFAQIEFQAS